jgi:hypothetical protein
MAILGMTAILPHGAEVMMNPYTITSSQKHYKLSALVTSGHPAPSSSPSSSTLFSSLSHAHATSWTNRVMPLWSGWQKKGCWQKQQNGRVFAIQNSANVGDAGEERVRLKKELLESLEATDGSLSQESLNIIESLGKLNPNPEASKVPELALGYFEAVKATLKGKPEPNAGVFVSTFTLGRAAFNAFQPKEQEVIHEHTYNYIATQGMDEEYLLASAMSIKNPDLSLQPLKGYLVNRGKFSFSGVNEMEVAFLESVLRPAHPEDEDELQTWKQLFMEKNPSMDERGFMTVNLPGAKGKITHIYLDDELRIVKGTGGNTFVTRRLPGPVVTL